MDLVPNIAFGDLDQSSLAEVVAAGFRAYATGTIAVEQGKGESRLFMRYGAPCGVQLYVGHRPFSYFLVENGHLDPGDSEKYLDECAKEGRRLGDVLVSHGVMTPDQVLDLVTQHHRECFHELCLLREGKYELRGWERPPDWTEPVVLDPLRAIVTAMAADELFDRRRELLDRIGETKLRLSGDFDDLASRLVLTPDEYAALQRLHVPRTVNDFVVSLKREDAEAFVVATALLGLTDADTGVSMVDGASLLRPVSDDAVVDAAGLLTPVESTSSPSISFLRPIGSIEAIEEDVVLDEDPAELLRPLPDSVPPPSPSKDFRAPWSAEMSAQLDAALAPLSEPAPATDAYSALPIEDIGLGPPELFEYTPSAPQTKAPATLQPPGEVEFEAPAEDEPLELDLDRAPAALREAMERSPARPPSPTSASRLAALKHTSPPRTAPTTPSRPVSTIAAKPPKPVDEYNPFAVHFRKAAAIAPSSMDELEARLERALRGEAAPRQAAAAPPPVPRASAARAAPAVGIASAPSIPPASSELSASILADIEETVGDLPEPTITGPITIDGPRNRRDAGDDDGLALLAAEEAARESALVDTEGLSTVVDDLDSEPLGPGAEEEVVVEEEYSPAPLPDEAVAMTLIEEPSPHEVREESGAEIRLTPVPAEVTPAPVEATPSPGSESTPAPRQVSNDPARDIRRRLLQRAFKNVAGTVMNREVSARHNVRAPDSVAPRPENADVTLEKDLSARLAELPKQDHFARLDVSRNAETDQVKEAFLNLAKRYHPDRLSAMGQQHLLPQARELFARIKESYDVLVDPAGRARYVSELNSKDGGNKVKLSPEEAKAAFLRGTHYLRKRDFKNAEAEFIRAIDGDPQSEYLAELAWTLLSNPAQRDSAKQEIRELMTRALKSGTETDRTFVVAAHIARADGNHDRAEQYFRKAIEKNPKNIEAARELRLIEMRRGSEKKTSSIFDKLRRSTPK